MKKEAPLFQKGMSYASWQHNAYTVSETALSISSLKKNNVKWVSLVVTWYQDTSESPVIYRDPYLTPDDEGVIQTVNRIHQMGMKVMLKPTVDVKDGRWRGEIEFTNEEKWQAWFSSYRYFINYYAKLATRYGIEQFCVGVELTGTVQREQEWRWVIKNVRERFKGPLVYAANWDSYDKVRFWDALDYVGIDAYFELSVGTNPKLDDLQTAWISWVKELETFHKRVKKPILFTEIGCRSVKGASIRPWEWGTTEEVDLQEQEHFYQAAFHMFWDKPWFYGYYWWVWHPVLSESDEINTSYTPQGKPAEKILEKWYSKPVKQK